MKRDDNGKFTFNTEDKVINVINSKFSRFEYIGGYVNADSFIYLLCKDCGNVFKHSTDMLRPSRNKIIKCKKCNSIIKNKKDILKIKDKELKKVTKLKDKEQKAILDQEERYKKLFKKCKECGTEFKATHGKQIYCDDICRKKYSNRIKEIDRRHKLRENGKIEWDITLNKLHKRDRGLCHICGTKVIMGNDSNDDYYGSIDHVKPISKGGTHTWDNVKLAHRKCNCNKRDKLIYEKRNGQLVMVI